VLIGSTGLIGVELPMALVRQNIGNVRLSEDGGNRFARSIMTTDTHPKETAISAQIGGREIVVGGCAKGSGMIHPNMATMLSFITTDAPVEQSFLQVALKHAVDASFNMIDVDGDQSTNDTVLVLANGKAGGDEIRANTPAGRDFQEALAYVCTELAKELARDGEGARHLIETTVERARTLGEARLGARAIASSLLVKTMVYGRDPNWGRIMMALGKSGIEFEESDVDIFINEIHIVHAGMGISYLKDAVVSSMSADEVRFKVRIGAGDASATAWGCDLTEGYVIENSAYST
jgi:glutamate N-acetyltransferase/amino-acid N-acetyltransferase